MYLLTYLQYLRIIIRYVEAIVGFLWLVGASDDAVPVPSVLILRMVNEWMEWRLTRGIFCDAKRATPRWRWQEQLTHQFSFPKKENN